MLTSHSRCHGMKPKEPWTYDASVMDKFREIVELKYRLMPYVYAQAKDSSNAACRCFGRYLWSSPTTRSWLVDDEYLLGSSLLVAPLLHEGAPVAGRVSAAWNVD